MTTITIETAKLKAALICASNDKIRPHINGVYVDPRGYIVSTDGHRLFCARIDLSGVPAFDGWLMPRDAIKRALTGCKFNEIVVTPDRIGDIACRPVYGVFPQWERVLPSHDLSGEIAQFNSAYVADLGEIGRILTGKRKADAGLTAHIHHNGQAPAGVTFPDCKDAFAVLMPIRSNHINQTSAWIGLRKAAPTV
jgi:DNA polymerase-3 subunit beta